MKQISDEVFAQVREALAMNRVMGRDADGNYTRDCTPKKITAALAALDTAQSVQPVGHISTKLGAFVQEGSWIGPLPVNKLFYAVSDRYSAAAKQASQTKEEQ